MRDDSRSPRSGSWEPRRRRGRGSSKSSATSDTSNSTRPTSSRGIASSCSGPAWAATIRRSSRACSRSASSSRRSRSSSRPAIWPSTRRRCARTGVPRTRAPPGRRTAGLPARAAKFLAQNPQLRRSVLMRLRRDGPLPLTAFEDRAVVSWTSGRWNDERNVTRMLAILQRRGEVVVAGRSRGRKLWTLAQGWLPNAVPLPGRALELEATLRALRATGVATLKQLRWHYAFSRQVTQQALDALVREGVAVRVEIADAAWKGAYYAPAGVPLHDAWEGRTTLLSPFDNLIIDRARTEQLFGYRYRMEIYTPPQLRKVGYWAMPVLHGDRIVGSVDPRFERARGELIVNKVVLEPNAPRNVMRHMRGAVEELATFVGATNVRWPRA